MASNPIMILTERAYTRTHTQTQTHTHRQKYRHTHTHTHTDTHTHTYTYIHTHTYTQTDRHTRTNMYLVPPYTYIRMKRLLRALGGIGCSLSLCHVFLVPRSHSSYSLHQFLQVNSTTTRNNRSQEMSHKAQSPSHPIASACWNGSSYR